MILQAGKLQTSCALPIKSQGLSAWNQQGQRDLAAHAGGGKRSRRDVPPKRGDSHVAAAGLCVGGAGVSPETWLSPSPDPLKGFAKPPQSFRACHSAPPASCFLRERGARYPKRAPGSVFRNTEAAVFPYFSPNSWLARASGPGSGQGVEHTEGAREPLSSAGRSRGWGNGAPDTQPPPKSAAEPAGGAHRRSLRRGGPSRRKAESSGQEGKETRPCWRSFLGSHCFCSNQRPPPPRSSSARP